MLCRSGAGWRLQRETAAWSAPVPVAQARDQVALAPELPDGLVVRAEWSGTRRLLHWTGAEGVVEVTLLEGRFNRAEPVPCRLSLDGSGPAVAALAARLVQAGAQVPQRSLARHAMQLLPALPAGSPPVREDEPAGQCLAGIITRQLTILLHWAALIPDATGPEPVHQMRVGTRRLRAALSTFKRVAACPELAAVAEPLKDCAARLGTARDWDVFLSGNGARLAAAFPDDPRCAAMLRAGRRRQRAVYQELRLYLAGPGFHGLVAVLAHAAATRPWEDGPAMPVFAADRLSARMKTVRRAGRAIETATVEALHELRKDCKRLRYTAEFVQSLYGSKATRRFFAALADLQEELGLLNDGTAISGLMAQLGRGSRGYAAGLAEGFTGAQSGLARKRVIKAWKRFRAVKPFWPSSSKLAKPLSVNQD